MTQLTEQELHDHIGQLNAQVTHLTAILSLMVDKMALIEDAAKEMREDCLADMAKLKDDFNGNDWKT
tara:strand:- start:1201 stop:1401 length:201 start_codon:yes stop_codon:yes gene_type:complete